eukprot:gene30022-17916_t
MPSGAIDVTLETVVSVSDPKAGVWVKDTDLSTKLEAQKARKTSVWSTVLLAYGSLGVIYGDIGTSVIYVFPAIFQDVDFSKSTPDRIETDIYGAISLIFWTISLVTLIKYIGVVLAANDTGEARRRCSGHSVVLASPAHAFSRNDQVLRSQSQHLVVPQHGGVARVTILSSDPSTARRSCSGDSVILVSPGQSAVRTRFSGRTLSLGSFHSTKELLGSLCWPGLPGSVSSKEQDLSQQLGATSQVTISSSGRSIAQRRWSGHCVGLASPGQSAARSKISGHMVVPRAFNSSEDLLRSQCCPGLPGSFSSKEQVLILLSCPTAMDLYILTSTSPGLAAATAPTGPVRPKLGEHRFKENTKAKKKEEKEDKLQKKKRCLLIITMLATGLIIGDGILMPAFSVVSAINGLRRETSINTDGEFGLEERDLEGGAKEEGRRGLLCNLGVGIYNLSHYGGSIFA